MIFYTSITEEYKPALKALRASMAENSPSSELIVNVYQRGLYTKLKKEGYNVEYRETRDVKLPVTSRWPTQIWPMFDRLWVPDYNEDERCAWIDADCVVLRDLSDLETFDLDKPVAAVKTSTTEMSQQVGGIRGKEVGKPALFAGLLIFNNQVWRDMDITQRCIEAMQKPLDFFFASQSVLSYALMGNFHELPYKWQVFANRKGSEDHISKDAKILHYVGGLPWKNEMKHTDIWRHYCES